MRYDIALSDADNEGQLGTNLTIYQPFNLGSGTLEDGEHNWNVGEYNEILLYQSGQAGSLGKKQSRSGLDLMFYVKYKGKWISGLKILAMFDSIGLKNSRGQAMIHKLWHKKGLSDGPHTEIRSLRWELRD
jgi:hypothetical protein